MLVLKRGFTLIELLVVLTIVSILLTLTVPRYFQSVDMAKEGVLVQNLKVVRDAIDKFSADTGRYPDSLAELVDHQYIKSLPVDPLTDSDSSWTILPPPSNRKGAVFDIKSSAQGVARNGKQYSEL